MNMVHHRTYGPGTSDTVWMEPKLTTGPDAPKPYRLGLASAAVERYWKLGDEIWAKSNNIF